MAVTGGAEVRQLRGESEFSVQEKKATTTPIQKEKAKGPPNRAEKVVLTARTSCSGRKKQDQEPNPMVTHARKLKTHSGTHARLTVDPVVVCVI